MPVLWGREGGGGGGGGGRGRGVRGGRTCVNTADDEIVNEHETGVAVTERTALGRVRSQGAAADAGVVVRFRYYLREAREWHGEFLRVGFYVAPT